MTRRSLILLVAALSACTATPTDTELQGVDPVPFDLVFEGNESVLGFTLQKQVPDLLIDFGRDPSKESTIFDLASDLADYYRDLGFPDVDVRYRIERQPKLKVVITVREGPRVTVSPPHIEGNTFLSTDALLPLWSRNLSGLLALGDPYFVEEDLRAFALAIRGRYQDQGYLDVQVTGPLVKRDTATGTASVDFSVHEGERYVLSSVNIDEGLAKPAGELDLSLVGKPYDPLALRSLRVALREALRARGYPEPLIHLEVEVNRQTKRVTAQLEGTPGERAKVVAIEVAGHERTAEHVIRNKIEFAEGEWFNGPKVDETESNLYLSGLFSRVRVERKERAPGEVVMTVRVEEVEAREIGFLTGYGSYEKVRGAIILGDHNLFGLGQRLRLVGRASTKSWGTDATWAEPEIFGTRTDLSVTTFLTEREEPAFTNNSWGASTALSRRLFSHAQARLGYSFQHSDASNVDPTQAFVKNDVTIGSVFTELSRDTRDSQIYPTAGHRELVRYEVASKTLGGDLEFSRLTARIDWHHPFATDWILSLAAQSGWIWPVDDEPLPVQERFYNGGQSTVRSFREGKLGPTTITGGPAGGEFRNVFNAELRYPIFRALKGAVFVDAGNVGIEVEDYGLADLRYAVGAGLRLALPIGPVRFDVGVNPDPKDGERDYTMHLAVGLPF